MLLLLSNGATRDATTKDNYTPLHIAVKEGHEDVVEILLDNGAKHDITTKVLHHCDKSSWMNTYLHVAWSMGIELESVLD